MRLQEGRMENGREKPIKDIRFFERAVEDVFGSPMPEYVGTLYPVVDRSEVGVLGTRYALELAERGFRTRGYHHVYVTLTPLIPEGEARVSPLRLESWLRFVDVGLPLERWPRESAGEQVGYLVRTATRALEHLCAVHGLDGTVIPEVEAALLEHGAELEITRLVKETAAGTVRVTFQALPYGTPSPVYLEYQESRSGRSGKIELMRVKDFEDVFPLIASASVSRGVITLKPRPSFRAGLTTRDYKTPIQVPIHRVLEGR
jgi:hypothetical protein